MIALPDIQKIEATTDDFLLIACDGIFEKLSNESVMAFVSREYERNPGACAIIPDMFISSRTNFSHFSHFTQMIPLKLQLVRMVASADLKIILIAQMNNREEEEGK